MIEAGTTLQQRYRIDKQIGQGGMGAVYVATDERFGSTVAIKETLCMDDNFRKAIEREARLLNSLKHSALPRVSDHFLERESQFLVMEYVQGEDLCRMLDEQGHAFPVEQVLKWADQLLDALDYLHNQSIPVVHRDIKPQNLKITPRGQMVLLDFGLAKGNPTDGGHQTAAKSIFGYSRNYASLEQIQGTGTDPRSDLYSLAATLYHLLTNTAPEDALTRAMSVLSQKPDPLMPANLINPKVPAGVAGVLQKALDLNAAERPSSAAEMKQMLRDSEKYAGLAVASTFAVRSHSANDPSQPTRLMGDDTRQRALADTDVRTEVFSQDNRSPATAAISGPSSKPKRRSFAVAAGLLIALLVGGSIAGGLYLADPSLFGATHESEKANSGIVPAANANTDVNANVETVQANTEVPVSETEETPAASSGSAHSAGRTTETAKSGKPAEKQGETDGETINIIGDPENPDEVQITRRDKSGKLVTTRISPNIPPINMPVPPADGYDPFPQSYEFKNLTPEQRRRMQQVWRNQMRKTPRPAPTPKSD